MTTVVRLSYLRRVIAGAYLCGMLMSLRLWFGLGRTFPRVPMVNGLPAFVWSNDYLLSALLLAALILSLVSKRPSRYLLAVVMFTALLVVVDQTRLQPWVYEYLLMLTVLAFWQPGTRHENDEKVAGTILSANQLIVAMLYFWSGVQKLNWFFGHEVVPGLLESAHTYLPATLWRYLPIASLVIALCELLLGVGLLIRRTRQASVVLALLIHFTVLILLIGARRNSVVWPWNVAMMATAVLLFWRSQHSPAPEIWRWRRLNVPGYLPKVALVICAVLPASSFFGWWDMYLSAALYSGNTAVAVMRITEQVRGRLPLPAQQQVFATKRGDLMLPFHEWSLAELNVPPYPEVRVYRQLARQVCAYAESPQEIELIVRERPSLIDGSYAVKRADCAELSTR
ncbi:MAG: hypothetical protein JWM21_3913 [Acidobacteria bacterium]|nr:hypothetical protein [Acidobacteriota bacterium]